jgi:two-component system, chemotaxis family, protein-glutamate methylesterase/glutaminase
MPPPYEAPANRSNRDVIVIGASMGGPAALTTLARELPPDLPAAVLVVQHQAAESPRALGRILGRESALPAEMARDRESLEPGRIYLAPPDRHLVLNERGMRVVFGPRENRSRPAIDVLFRSAAVHYRSRVTGVILSGMLDDGAAGLLAVRRCGGAAVVQAPSDSEHAEMPSRALEAVPDAEQVPLADMAAHLARRAAEAAPEPPPVPDMLWTEARLTEGAMTAMDETSVPGESTDLTCPECRGPLWEMPTGGPPRFRCRVGHAYSRDALVRAKDDSAEEALWVALQTLEERARMLERLARGDGSSFAARAEETQRHADGLRAFLARLTG